jgi:23S rRNA (cytidine1920-2'-O)/16S rRNA (cytidine1409-2'-O)-methyltransferase
LNIKKKVRLDVLLMERGLFPSRESARRAVMAGEVSSDGGVLEKPGTQVANDIHVEVKRPLHQFVGRGGLKLERALSVFDVSCEGKIVVDIGASTGGFTDCALQNGAQHVYSVDVGYGQLAWKLRNDARVTVMERTNFRYVDCASFNPPPEMAVMDVSFISTKLLFSKIAQVCGPNADVVSLIKPQFEAGREHVGKGGIVRNPEVHLEVILDMMSCIHALGWACCGLDYSPISGGDGNIEFLGWWKTAGKTEGISLPEQTPLEHSNELDPIWTLRAKEVVLNAWEAVGKQAVFLSP